MPTNIITYANITAAAGDGIRAYNYGTGSVTVTDEPATTIQANGTNGRYGIDAFSDNGVGTVSVTTSTGDTISARDYGIAAYALDGGNASISNSGTVSAPTGIGLVVEAIGGAATGTAIITNDGSVTGDGTASDPVIQTDSATTTLTNESGGTIAPSSSSASGLAIADTGGSITIYNYGTIIGDVALGNTTFNNESGGVWDVSGVNSFGSGSNIINNAGAINMVAGTTALDVALDNTSSVDVQAGTLDIAGAVTGTGSLTIGSGAALEFGGTVASGTTVDFAASTGSLMLEQPSSFGGAIAASAGNLTTGDIIYLAGFNGAFTTATPTTFNSSTDTTTLLVTDPHDGLSVSLTPDGNYLADTFTASSASGGADIADPPPAATIFNGASLDIGTSSNETVTFTGTTGSLVIGEPGSFTGEVIGFSGTAPDAAHSDIIDLVGINYDSPHFSEAYNAATGLLSVSDGANVASLTFINFAGTLNFSSDGNGGTLITDPPKQSQPTNSSLPADAAPTVELNHDRDRFNFDRGSDAHQSNGINTSDGRQDPSESHNAFVSIGASATINSCFSRVPVPKPSLTSIRCMTPSSLTTLLMFSLCSN